jgi:hypothetical protein
MHTSSMGTRQVKSSQLFLPSHLLLVVVVVVVDSFARTEGKLKRASERNDTARVFVRDEACACMHTRATQINVRRTLPFSLVRVAHPPRVPWRRGWGKSASLAWPGLTRYSSIFGRRDVYRAMLSQSFGCFRYDTTRRHARRGETSALFSLVSRFFFRGLGISLAQRRECPEGSD